MGYYGVFMGLHYRNDLAVTSSLDSDTYDESRSIVIKVPVSVPYMLDQTNFERVNGTFEHNGEFYRLVKQKYANDTLNIVCIKDFAHKRIDQALTDYLKTFSDNTGDEKSSKITINFLKDYLPINFSLCTILPGWSTNIQHTSAYGTLIPAFMVSIAHPPEKA